MSIRNYHELNLIGVLIKNTRFMRENTYKFIHYIMFEFLNHLQIINFFVIVCALEDTCIKYIPSDEREKS